MPLNGRTSNGYIRYGLGLPAQHLHSTCTVLVIGSNKDKVLQSDCPN